MEADLVELAAALGTACLASKITLATAESCTGGWLSQVITHTEGSSQWFERGFVSYANAAKADMLGVRMNTIETYGAVSPNTAAEMAVGALVHSTATLAVAITGVAGPGGGSADKPVGTVCFGWCWRDQLPSHQRRLFVGDREAIRRQSVVHALHGLIDSIGAGRARNMP